MKALQVDSLDSPIGTIVLVVDGEQLCSLEERVRGLEDKSHANTNRQPTVDLRTRYTIRKKQEENPLLGEYRMHGALLQLGIRVSPRTCGRIMAENRQLYGLTKPPAAKIWPKTGGDELRMVSRS